MQAREEDFQRAAQLTTVQRKSTVAKILKAPTHYDKRGEKHNVGIAQS